MNTQNTLKIQARPRKNKQNQIKSSRNKSKTREIKYKYGNQVQNKQKSLRKGELSVAHGIRPAPGQGRGIGKKTSHTRGGGRLPRGERGLRTEGACPSPAHASPSGGDGVLGSACTCESFFFLYGGRILGRARREGGRERDDDGPEQTARGPGAAGVGAALSAGLRPADIRWAAPGESLCCKRDSTCTLLVPCLHEGHATIGVRFFLSEYDRLFATPGGTAKALGYNTPHQDNRMSSVRCDQL